jgi:serine/threonine-protein kinase
VTTGQKLFNGDSGFAIRQAHAHQPPLAPTRVNPAISPLLEAAILKAVAKKPEERFQSADSLYQAIQQVRVKLDPPRTGDACVPSYSLPGKVLWCTTGLLLTIAIVVGGVRRESPGSVQQPPPQVPAILPVSPLPVLPEPPVTKPVRSVAHHTPPHLAPVPPAVVHPQTSAADEDPSIVPAPKSRLGKLKGSLKRLNPFGRKSVQTASAPE